MTAATIHIVDADAGLVECVPRRKRVGIVGFSAASVHLTPWADPSIELWGLNQVYTLFERRADRWFEIHRPEARIEPDAPDYLDRLNKLDCPIYMIEREAAFPTSVTFPLARVQERVPDLYRGYFTCCVAYMIALALDEGFESIELYGVDCAVGTEYYEQKPCIEAWLSLAMGRGVRVVVPETSSLFKTPFLYGYEPPKRHPRVLKASETWLRERVKAYEETAASSLKDLHHAEGAMHELQQLLNFAEAAGRGTRFPKVAGDE